MLIVVGGPMFSGKTTRLIHYAENLVPGSFILYKPDIDTRYGQNACVTHNGKSFPAINLNTKKVDFSKINSKIKTILIDELNFFSADKLLEAIDDQQKQRRDIIGAGLLFDYNKQPFGATLPLSQKADTFIQLYATCDRCKKKAAHSYRKIAEKNQVLLGASETYGACCEVCWELLSKQ